jgi:hypothetical protein
MHMQRRRPQLIPMLATTAAALLTGMLGGAPAVADGPASIVLAADSRPAEAAPLNPGQLAKIQKLIDEKHRRAVIDRDAAKLLGLGRDGKPVVAQQVALIDKNKSTRHLFDRLEDGSGYLVGRRSADGMTVYRVGNDLTWIASVAWRKDGNKVALKSSDAEKTLRQELTLWAEFADRQK